MAPEPTNLKDAIIYFADAENGLTYLVARRWPDGVVVCPTCGKKSPRYIADRKVWQCSIKHPRRQFSVKLGTIFEDSPLGLDKWLPAVWLLSNCKNGSSSFEVARDLGVTQKTAWFMLQRIRLGLQTEGGMLSGEVEVDETFIGGKARNVHAAKRKLKIQGRGQNGKAVVMGMLQRGGKVKTAVIADRDKPTLHGHVNANIEIGSNVFTDDLISYWGLDEQFVHQVINHAEQYVQGNVHTNGMENFWSLLKRGPERHLRIGRAVPSVPLHRRTGVPLQQPEA